MKQTLTLLTIAACLTVCWHSARARPKHPDYGSSDSHRDMAGFLREALSGRSAVRMASMVCRAPGKLLQSPCRPRHPEQHPAFPPPRARLRQLHPDVQRYDGTHLAGASAAIAVQRPEVRELVWARDVLLRKIPPPPVTASGGPLSTLVSRNACAACGRAITGLFGKPEPLPATTMRRWRGYCAPCADDAEHARLRDLRCQARANRECASCGGTFTPMRSDGRYSSPACRQKAYRQRADHDGRQQTSGLQLSPLAVPLLLKPRSPASGRPGSPCLPLAGAPPGIHRPGRQRWAATSALAYLESYKPQKCRRPPIGGHTRQSQTGRSRSANGWLPSADPEQKVNIRGHHNRPAG
jgi:hypothetical protein